jgi:hypothetical protein
MIKRSRKLHLFFAALLWAMYGLSACSPELSTVDQTITATDTKQVTEDVQTTQTPSEPEDTTDYAVVRVPRGESLVIRQPAGQSGTEVGFLDWNAKQLRVTGNRTLLGSSLWLEVEFGVDGLGWVNSLNITESISANDFCGDQRVIDLLNSLRSAVENADDNRLAQLLNENRGLAFRLNWYSPEIRFTIDDVTNLHSLQDDIEWGTLSDSGITVIGTFKDVMLPKLEDVFLQSPEATCNALKYGSTAGEILWPEELTNMKFYGIYRDSESNGNEFDWRSWAVGIEYADGNPYIAVLIHYSSEL